MPGCNFGGKRRRAAPKRASRVRSRFHRGAVAEARSSRHLSLDALAKACSVLAKDVACATQPRGGGADGNVEHRGDAGCREAFDLEQNEDGAKIHGKPFEQLVEVG